MSNLYEILEVSEKASKEVIEKAYRVLAKKYHPDLQIQEEKQNAEKRMKQINEAYDILSNEEKRKEYDRTLAEERRIEKQKQEQRQSQQNEIEIKQTESENKKRENGAESYQNIRKIQKEMNQAYSQAYRNYIRSLRISSKRTLDVETIYKFTKSIGNHCHYYLNYMVVSAN